ncbi:MAG: flagellar basal body-associated FliL family protein [Deltaproteobacteria bacterium]|jgi:flagellar FliL protein|nr:flagellar basal body-associated FliL family protein [Deltaproteobacteria bacterium]
MAEEPGARKEDAAVSAKTEQKVELDLEDAAFLEEEPKPEPKPEPEEAPPPSKEASPLPAESGLKGRLAARKKKLILAGGAAVLLIVLAVAVNTMLFSKKPPPPPPPPPPKEEVKKEPPPPQQYVMQWERFWVEIKDTEGAVRFLTFRFSIPTENQILFAEMQAKRLILRDALFYYLRNQPILSLSDEARVQTFKADLMTVINEQLGSGKVSDLLIQDYLLQ